MILFELLHLIITFIKNGSLPKILEVILKLFPLNTYAKLPVCLMAVTPGDTVKPVIWNEYKKIILESKELLRISNTLKDSLFMREPEKLMRLLRPANQLCMRI
jgi:L-fucose mutarotase/ribose pyranase (RbsD/FucU family)